MTRENESLGRAELPNEPEEEAVSRKQVEEFLRYDFLDYFQRMVGTLVFWLRNSIIVYDDGIHNLMDMFLEDNPDFVEKLAAWLPFTGTGI